MNRAALQAQVEEEILAAYPSLYRLAYTYVKNKDDAMDIVQESVYKAICNSSRVQHQEAIKSWLCRIVVNTSLDLLRARAKVISQEEIPESGREDAYQDPDLLRALDMLEERERTIIVLRFFQELKLQEIAEITGEKLNTVKSTLYRGLKKLRVQLSEGGYDNE